VGSFADKYQSLYVDMAMTIVRHMLTVTGRLNDTIGLDCGSMKVDKPFIASPHASPQLLRVSATADWLRGEVSLLFYSANAQSQKAADHATCTVLVTEQQHWIEDWKRSTYLIQSRIDSLHAAVNGGKAHKLKRGLAYKLFATLVDYSVDYQGMQEVVLDSDALEASARVQFQVEDGGFYQSPCWIDSCGHIAGFIMNGNDNIHSKGQVFINHGWTRRGWRSLCNRARRTARITECNWSVERCMLVIPTYWRTGSSSVCLRESRYVFGLHSWGRDAAH